MEIISLFAGVVSIYIVNYLLYRNGKVTKKLKEQNERLSEYLLTDGSKSLRNPHAHHIWRLPQTEELYSSKLPWSYDRVLMETWVCTRCHIVHKVIVQGSDLAKRKNLSGIEGYYVDGSKQPDPGCIEE